MMVTWLVALLAFLGVFLAVIAANAVLVELASNERRRMKEEVLESHRQRVKFQVRAHDLEEVIRRSASSPANFRDRLSRLIEQSGLEFTVQQLFLASAIAAICGVAVLFYVLALNLGFENAILPSALGAFGGVLPLLYVLYTRKKRQAKIFAALPDAFELMGRVLRAGQTLSYAMQIVADQGSPPLSLEFYRCNEQMTLGLTPEAALRNLAHRTGVLEMRIFTVAILVQRQTGGNLSALFDKMGSVVRERFRINGMITALTAQGRLQAGILTAMPVAMFAWLMYSQPGYERELFNYPVMCVMAVAFLVAGTLWIRKVVNFDY
jgi:tight adherence protein B